MSYLWIYVWPEKKTHESTNMWAEASNNWQDVKVGNSTLLHINQRLNEISDNNNSQLFAGIGIIALGDLYYLPPIQRKLVFDSYANNAFNVCHPWHAFEMIEIIEIMRQMTSHLLNFWRLISSYIYRLAIGRYTKCIQFPVNKSVY